MPLGYPAQTMFDVIKYDGYFDFGLIQFLFVIRGTVTNCKSLEMDPSTKQSIRYTHFKYYSYIIATSFLLHKWPLCQVCILTR